MLKAYVITIPRLKERRNQFKSKWEGRIEYEFISGVDYLNLNFGVLNHYSKTALPQLCIAHAHFSLYAELLKTKENRWLIMEDDAIPTRAWIDFDFSPLEKFDFIKLHTPYNFPTGILKLDLSNYISTSAYFISRKSIEKLMEYTVPVMPIDQLLSTYLDCYAVFPKIVITYSQSSY